jgi:capsular exopolysaccharide synthesis family protein
MHPVYKAISRVQVEAETPLMQSLNQIDQETQTDDAFLQTQIEILKSDTLAWQTITSLGLNGNPEFDRPDMAISDPEKRKENLISRFEKSRAIELVPKTRMILIGFESRDPRLAARASSALAANYIDYSFRRKYNATREASAWMELQLGDLKTRVQTSQAALVEYEREHSIVNTGEKRNLQEQILSELSSDLTLAKNERIQKESLYDQVLTNPAQTAKLAHNPLLEKLEEKYADQKAQYAEMQAQYGPKHPQILHQKQQLAEMDGQITQEQNRVIDRTRDDYNAAQRREQLLAAAVNKQKKELESINELLVQHNILERDFESNQQLYQNLLQRLKDATISAGLHSGNLQLVDNALPPTKPVRPNKPLSILIGLLTGLLLGAGLAYVQESVDHSVKSVQEVESIAALPALGVIPLRQMRHAPYGLFNHGNGGGADGDVALTVTTDPRSVVAEACRSLRTAILLSTGERVPRKLLITSAHAHEGKSTIALNLAQSLAQQKRRVLLIDADLRKPSIAKSLKLGSDRGLSTVLSGQHKLEEAIQPSGVMPELSVLAGGPTPSNPAELLSSDRMPLLLQDCMRWFNHVIIDSPPVLSVTDAAIISELVDGVILVVEGDRTAKGALLRARKILSISGARILGVALNKFDLRDQDYYGYGRSLSLREHQ